VSEQTTWTDERLADLAALPTDHPDVLAVRGDPASWARLLALREFLHPAAIPEGARTGEAVARLRTAVGEALDRDAVSVTEGVPRPIRAERRSLAEWFTGWRPALAAAAAVVVVGALLLPRLTERSGTLRGPDGARIETLAPVGTTDGVRFAWRQVAGADLYELRLLRADLSAAVPVVATAETSATVAAAEITPLDESEGAAFWLVSALRAGRVVAESELHRMDSP
jgi:hypothetical protein